MKITSFNPGLITGNAEAAIALFEALGFERRHTKTGINDEDITTVRMKDANGFHVDVSEGSGEWTMIRVNVDDLEEAFEFFKAHGFRMARHEAASETIDTGSSKLNIMVSPTGAIFAVSQHTKD